MKAQSTESTYTPDNIFKKIWFKIKTHVKSKEFKKKWIRRAIVIGIIGIFALSLVIKDNIARWPYKKDDCVTISGQQITGQGQYTGIFRLNTFMSNVTSDTEDAMRIFAFTKFGYEYTMDLEYNGEVLTLTMDLRGDKTLTDDQRVVVTETYTTMYHALEDSVDNYYLLNEETGSKRLIYYKVRQEKPEK